MIDNKFECLPIDILFAIFGYLSSVDILQSFSPLNKRFSAIFLFLQKVCSYLPILTICRHPLNYCSERREKLFKSSSTRLMVLPNLSNTNHLRTLTIGISSSEFLERLLACRPFIENLSTDVHDLEMSEDGTYDIIT